MGKADHDYAFRRLAYRSDAGNPRFNALTEEFRTPPKLGMCLPKALLLDYGSSYGALYGRVVVILRARRRPENAWI
jgi:hypothetical protein